MWLVHSSLQTLVQIYVTYDLEAGMERRAKTTSRLLTEYSQRTEYLNQDYILSAWTDPIESDRLTNLNASGDDSNFQLRTLPDVL